MHVTCPFKAPHSATTNLSPIHLANSKYANMVQHALPPQHPAHPFDFSHTVPILACTLPALCPDTSSSSTSVPKVMEANCPVLDIVSSPSSSNFPVVLHECANMMPCLLSPHHLVHLPDFNHARAHTSNATCTPPAPSSSSYPSRTCIYQARAKFLTICVSSV